MKARNGVWMSDFYLSNGERIRVSLKTRDKAEAKLAERSLQVQLEEELKGNIRKPARGSKTASSGFSSGGCGITFSEAFRRAMREYESWRSSTSQKTIADNFKHTAAYFGEEVDLTTFSRPLMLEYVEELREDGKSPSTINQRLSLVSVLLTLAEDWTEGAVTPFKMPRQTVRKGRIRTLSYKEERSVVEWFLSVNQQRRPKARDMADLTEFLADTGFRLTEALTLQSREVQWENSLVPAWETKADHPRLVPMTGRVKEILRARSHLDLPFGMFTKDSAEDNWDAMRVGLRINRKSDPEFVIHALRHTCASRLAAEGVDAFRIQAWMGHKSIVTTQKYVTLFGPDLHGGASALDQRRESVGMLPPRAVSKSVPKSVPRSPPVRITRHMGGPPQGADSKGIRPRHRTEATVGVGLLIRRSLVRAQVEEPKFKGSSRKARPFCFFAANPAVLTPTSAPDQKRHLSKPVTGQGRPSFFSSGIPSQDSRLKIDGSQ